MSPEGNKREFINFLDEVIYAIQKTVDRKGDILKKIVYHAEDIVAELTQTGYGLQTSVIDSTPFKSRLSIIDGAVKVFIDGEPTVLDINTKSTELVIRRGARFEAQTLTSDVAMLTVIYKE